MEDFSIESRINGWRTALQATGDVGPQDVEELESHLREEIHDLTGRGLSESEALIIATRRIGETHKLSREYFKVNVNKLWKNLAVPSEFGSVRRETVLAAALAIAAALLAQIPYLFGGSYFGVGREEWSTFASLWILPSMVGWFVYRHRISRRRLLTIAGSLGAIHLFVALFPFGLVSSTRVLVMLHIPFLSWVLLMPAAVGKSWRTVAGIVHYLRLSAEAFIYSVLIGLGGATLMVLSVAIFASAGIDLEPFAVNHVSIAGIFGIPVVGVVLADRKRQAIENFAPTLARIFVPLFTVSLGAFLIALIVLGTRPAGDRDLLLVMNVLLLLVGAMLFYDVSARVEDQARRVSDWANLVLTVVALILNGVALSAIASRLLEYGASPNRAAVFGLNVILLVHLVVMLMTYTRYMIGRIPFRAIESAVVRFLPVYAVWLVTVVVAFPVLFRGT